ncbi:MAG: acyl-ACP--UDP-N-acetylglucosamine O-acyltransferase [Deltaproteobacteria bacterium]|nr:acyl-ACP--UDP-N-acetylglucosamine O-acyltransferase [Deltaproteobacteria bacterium]
MSIHRTAIIHPSAVIEESVEIGPYVVIGQGVTIGAGTKIGAQATLEGPDLTIGQENQIGPHAYLLSHTTLGDRNKIYPFSAIGCEPQDLKFKGEKSQLEIGHENIIRESVTINRGTSSGGGITRLGNRNMLMAYVHVAHDCLIGHETVIANSVALAGHVEVQDGAVIGGLVGIRQFCRIGKYAYVGGCTGTNKDIPPYMIASGPAYRMYVSGVNSIGLQRRGFDPSMVRDLKNVCKILYFTDLSLQEALLKIKNEFSHAPHVLELVTFIENSKTGIVGAGKEEDGEESKRRGYRGRISRQLSC